MLSFLKKDKPLNYIFSPYQSIQINGFELDAEIANCNLNGTVKASDSAEIDMTNCPTTSMTNCLVKSDS
jgi:hypothetical protein